MYTLSWKRYSLMAVASFSRIMPHCHKAEMVQECFEEHNNQFEVLPWPPNSPDVKPTERLWDALDKQVRSMEDLFVPDTTAHLQRSSASMGRGCFGSKRGTYTIWGRWSVYLTSSQVNAPLQQLFHSLFKAGLCKVQIFNGICLVGTINTLELRWWGSWVGYIIAAPI